MINESQFKGNELFSTSGWITFFLLPIIIFQTIGYFYLPRAYGLLFFSSSCLILILSNRRFYISAIVFSFIFFWIQNTYDYVFGYPIFIALFIVLWGIQKMIVAFENERQELLKQKRQHLEEKNLWIKRFNVLYRQQKHEENISLNKDIVESTQLDLNLD